MVTPQAPQLPDLPDIQFRAVELTGAWTDAFNTASENLTTLLNNFNLAPGVATQQFLANQASFIQQMLADPSNNNAVAQQIQSNLDAMVTGYAMQGADADTTTIVQQHTLDGGSSLGNGHQTLFSEIPGYLPADQASTITPIINFLDSPLSGIIMGSLGPFIAPWAALINSISDGDSFSDTLANMFGAFFNGADLNLDSLVPTINGLGLFPAGMHVNDLDIGFGGLFSTGSVSVGPYQVLDSAGNIVDSVPAVGGSIFNSVGLNITGVPVISSIDAPSQAIGPIAAWEAWGQTLGALLGSGWSGNGPIEVTAPLGFDFPLITDDGGVAASAMADLSTWWQDLTAAF